MRNMKKTISEGLVAGTTSSVLSTLALALAGDRPGGSLFAATNAISHWLWKDEAYAKNRFTLRHTVTGYLIHHLASTFWATLHACARRRPDATLTLPSALSSGVAASAAACFVDYRLTPARLRPGFEKRVSTPAMVGIYLSFGVGLALGAWAFARCVKR